MRPLSLLFSASLLVLAPTAGAQSNDYPLSPAEPISTVQVTAATKGFRIWDYQAEAVSGAYAMSNGWRLKVKPARDGIIAQIDKRRPMHLVAMSADKFVSIDGNVSMDFNRGDSGEDMMMSYVPESRLAEVVVISAHVAQR